MKALVIVLTAFALSACAGAKSDLKGARPQSVSELEKKRQQKESSVLTADPTAAAAEIPVMKADSGHYVYMRLEGLAFAFDADFPEAFKPACLRAMETANKALGRMAFTSVKEPGTFDTEDDHSVISWGKSTEDFVGSLLKDCVEGGKTEQACRNMKLAHVAETYLRSSKRTGAIGEADIDFDIRQMEFTVTGEAGKADVESVCLHELGHALGLAHSNDPQSVMYQGGNEIRRAFTARDISNLRAYDQTTKTASK